MTKKLFAMLLALTMVLSMFPATAMASEATTNLDRAKAQWEKFDAEPTWVRLQGLAYYYGEAKKEVPATHSDLVTLTNNIEGLTELDLSGKQIPEGYSQDLGALAFFPNLESLDISGLQLGIKEGETVPDFGALAKLTKLETLNVSNTNLANFDFVWVDNTISSETPALPNLQSLTATGLHLDSIAGLAELAQKEDFDTDGYVWDLTGSTVDHTQENSEALTLIDRHFDGEFTAPKIVSKTVITAETWRAKFDNAYENNTLTWNTLIGAMAYYSAAVSYVSTEDSTANTYEIARVNALRSYYNDIETLNMSGKALPSYCDNLGALEYLPNLTELDISDVTGIANFGALAKLTKLETLNVSGTSLTNFDFVWVDNTISSEPPALKELKTVSATDLELDSIAGLAQIAQADGFDASGYIWDLTGSDLAKSQENSEALYLIRSNFAGGTFKSPDNYSNTLVDAEIWRDKFATAYENNTLTWNTLIGAMAYYSATANYEPIAGGDADKNETARLNALRSYYNSIETLNMSGKALPSYCDNLGALEFLPNLTSLNISGVKGINDFGALAKLTKLETLNVSNTSLTNFNFVWVDNTITSETPALKDLKTLTAKGLTLSSISGLVEMINAEGFDPNGITWDLSGSTCVVEKDETTGIKFVDAITNAFKDSTGVWKKPSAPSSPSTPSVTPSTPSTPSGKPTVETDSTGSKSETVVDKNGVQTTEVTVTNKAINNAVANGEAVSLPMPEVTATTNTATAPTVTVTLPSSVKTAKVEIPVENVTAGTVAVIVHADGTEEVVPYSVPTEDGIALTVENGATVKIVDNSRDFSDVPATHTFSDAVAFASARGIIEGYGESFGVKGNATSAATVTVIARMMGEDFYGSGSTTKAKAWAEENGIAAGLDLSGNVTRQQYMLMLWRAAGSPAASGTVDSTDAASIDAASLEAFAWAMEIGLVGGYDDGSVRPNANISRGAMAAIAQRYMIQQ